MAVLSIVMVEDQAEHAACLENLLIGYQNRHPGTAFQIRSYDNPFQFLSDYRCNADLIFLDIQMPEMDGMQAAKSIRAMDPKVMLIFTTALAQYAIAGYEVQAFDYILKPLKAEIFEAKLERALRMLNYGREEEWVEIRTKTETRRVSVGTITYIEVNNHEILVHTLSEAYTHWGNLREYEEKLASVHFARCNTCYLVNLQYVTCVTGDTVQVGKDVLTISRSRRKEFLTTLAKYKGGSL